MWDVANQPMSSTIKSLFAIAVAVVLSAEVHSFGDDRLLNPGSPEEPSPAALEAARAKSETKALDAKIKHVHDLGEAWRRDPHKAAQSLRKEAQTVQGELKRDLMHHQHIVSDAAAAESLFRSIKTPAQTDADEIASDTLFSTKLLRNMKQTDEHQSRSTDLGESNDLDTSDISKAQAQARVNFHQLQDRTAALNPNAIRRNAQMLADAKEQTAAEAAALREEKADESEMQIAHRADNTMQLKGYLAIQRQKLEEVRISEKDEVQKLGVASKKLSKIQNEVGASLREEEILRDRASTMRMSSATTDRDLGQSMEDDSTEQQFASHVADALASRLAKSSDGKHMSAAQRGHLVATVWREGNTMVSKEAQLAAENNRYKREKAAYAVRSKWNQGSLVQAYNVETEKWYHGTVLARHKRRLKVRFHHLGIEEWLPDGSKRLRIPRDAVEFKDDDGPLLGQSESDTDTSTAHMAGTMTQGQVQLVEKGLVEEHRDQKNVLHLVDSVSKKTDQLRQFVKAHLLHPQKRVTSKPNGASEFFIARAARQSTSELGEGDTMDMSDLLSHDHNSALAGPKSSYGNENQDLGESADLGEDADINPHRLSERKIREHDAAAVQAYQAKMDHISDVNAKNQMLKMRMAELAKSALQHEVIERAKIARLAKQAGTYQHMVADRKSVV